MTHESNLGEPTVANTQSWIENQTRLLKRQAKIAACGALGAVLGFWEFIPRELESS